MNTVEVDHFLKSYRYYHGTYPRDLIPKYIPNNYGLIVNTDKSNMPGEHWVALYKVNDCVIYFDSFGLPPLHEEIIKFIKANSIKGWYYNTINFQSVYSNTCGVYCVFYLTNYFNGGNFENFCKIFNFNCNINDKLAKKLYQWRLQFI